MADEFVNLVDPQSGQVGSVPAEQLQDALSQGYAQASPDQVAQGHLQAKYGTGEQAAKAALEGIASGATLGLSTGLERMAGVNPADISARRAANPGYNAIGQGLGLGLSAASTLGAAPALQAAGEAIAPITEATGMAGRIGSALTRGAVENALYQSGDEVSKMLASDPEQTASTAAANVGLSGLIGGGLGAGLGSVSELWHAANGAKTAGALNALAQHAGGEDLLHPQVGDALSGLGIDIPPEVRANLASDPAIAGMAKQLEQSDTSAAGRGFQETLKGFKDELGKKLIGVFGHTPESAEGLSDLSKYESGKNIGNNLADEFDAKAKPLSDQYDKLRNQFAGVEVHPQVITKAADDIAALASKEGWAISPSSDIMGEVQRVLKELPNVKTLNELGDYVKAVGSNMQADPLNGPLMRAGGMIKGVLRDAESDIIGTQLADRAPEALAQYEALRPAYQAVSELKDSIDARLHTNASTGGFSKAVREMASESPEKLLQRLSGSSDADILAQLNTHFPETAQALREYHGNAALSNAMKAAKGNDLINSAALLRQVDRMSPEMRQFVLPQGAADTVKGIDTILSQFNSIPHNFSNTARTLDKLTKGVPGTAASMALLLSGHGGAAFVAKAFGNLFTHEVPDAVRLGALKYLGSNQQMSTRGFAGMVNFISQTMRGETALNKGVKAVFDLSTKVLPTTELTPKEHAKIAKLVDTLPPDQLAQIGGQTGHYLPDHAASIGNVAGTVLQTLSAAKPALIKRAPWDPEPVPTPQQTAMYQKAMTFAEKPLSVLTHMVQGSLSSSDVQMFKAMYPGIYSRLSDKLLTSLTDKASDGETIPYKLRISLATFLQQPLDSSMTPQAFAANQATFQAAQPTPPQQQAKPSKAGMNKIKDSQMALTPSQASAAKKQTA